MSSPTPPNDARKPISPTDRARLQQLFAKGSQMAGAGNFDYATEMFVTCVARDPGNLIYVQNFLGNLQKKYNNNKKGSWMPSLKGGTSKGYLTKAGMQKDWMGVIKAGLDLLKLNPWDLATLKAMANACEQLQFDECQLAYLKLATDIDLKDPEVNRLRGRALARQGKFDEAILCFTRVRQVLPTDEEAGRAIGNLTVERTIHKGGYEEAKSSTEVMADKDAQADRQGTSGPKLTPEQLLEKAIGKNPSDLNNYSELADLHLKHDRLEQAEGVLARALSASGGEVTIRERLEDVQLRRAQEKVGVALKRAQAERTEESKGLWVKMVEDLNNTELEVFRSRSERYPDNAGLKFELAVRMQKAKKYNDAIKLFQESRADTKRRGQVFLALGECFQAIKQWKLAASNYDSAVNEISDRDLEQRKVALYRAGKLALYLRNVDAADKYLTELAGLDFGYKDVSDLLDKLARMREDGEPPSGSPPG